MNKSVRFCLSYDPLKWDFIAFKINIHLITKRIADTVVDNDVAKVLLHVWASDFNDTTFHTE